MLDFYIFTSFQKLSSRERKRLKKEQSRRKDEAEWVFDNGEESGESSGSEEPQDDMSKMMGFSGFGSKR